MNDLSPEYVKQQFEKFERFDARKADQDTLAFRRITCQYKDELYLMPIKVGNKTVYFLGAGKDKLMTGQLVFGEDMTGPTTKKGWIVWGNENPIIRKTILEKIAELNGDSEVCENVYKKTYRHVQEQAEEPAEKTEETPEAGACFVKASEL